MAGMEWKSIERTSALGLSPRADYCFSELLPAHFPDIEWFVAGIVAFTYTI